MAPPLATTELKIRAERKLGALLREMLPHQGGRKRLHNATVSLADVGITKSQSHRWQLEAEVPEGPLVS